MRDPRATASAEAPAVDDHVVMPEPREELLRDKRLHAAPSLPEHGDPHLRLDVALGTHTRAGYVGSTDLLTRAADDCDFATDSCIRKEGIAPATVRRYLRLILRARGVSITEADEARVASCDDPAALDEWITRAATATDRAQVFDGESAAPSQAVTPSTETTRS